MENKNDLILEVDHLTVNYELEDETVEAVRDVSFRLEKGKTLGLVGETGAGKTTTALSILNLIPDPPGVIKGGTIELDGENVLEKTIKDPHPNVACVDAFQSWMDGTCVTIDERNLIKRFVPKKDFVYEDIPSYYKTVNIYKFSKDFAKNEYIPFLRAYAQALGLNEYYEQVLRVVTLLDKP